MGYVLLHTGCKEPAWLPLALERWKQEHQVYNNQQALRQPDILVSQIEQPCSNQWVHDHGQI